MTRLRHELLILGVKCCCTRVGMPTTGIEIGVNVFFIVSIRILVENGFRQELQRGELGLHMKLRVIWQPHGKATWEWCKECSREKQLKGAKGTDWIWNKIESQLNVKGFISPWGGLGSTPISATGREFSRFFWEFPFFLPSQESEIELTNSMNWFTSLVRYWCFELTFSIKLDSGIYTPICESIPLKIRCYA